jgi:PAS domain S-box-containing protein
MSDSLRVLVVEDNPGDADLLLYLLPKDSCIKCVSRLSEALDCVLEQPFDIVLLDLGLPDSFGLATLRIMRGQANKMPIIVLTGNNDEQTGVDAIREGAQDYLIKGETDKNLLARSIKYAVERKQSENALKELNDTLEERVFERTAQISGFNEALQRAKEEWERTFASVPDLIATLDNQHRVLRVNDAMARRLGLTPEECIGLPCYEVVHGTSVPPEFCPHSRTGADGLEHVEELHVDRFEGDFLVTTTPLLDEKGASIGSVHIAHDITERKRFEKGLQQAKEVAEAATRAKSQFLANMSHELRTPMTGVLGMLDLVLLGNLEEEQREFIKTAQTSARSLVTILNDILDLTKIEMGKLSIEEKPFSLRECVGNTLNILLPLATSKMLDLNLTVADDIPETMVGDKTRLNQVLTNLAGNAVKFTKQGKVEIRVTAGGNATGAKLEVTFTVTDTGIGIPDDKKDLLFRAFSQVDESHSRRYGGTGLGLAISKEIVERMGGKIGFTSVAGKGSTFSCTIPLGVVDTGPDAIMAPGTTAAVGRAPRGLETTRPRLLIAEDDPTIRQVLGSMLQRLNYEICFAENGHRVVEMWENGSYDLILMDVQMPGMNGFEATGAIREKERTRGGYTPIVAMTAHALKKDEERCLDAGMDSYISKPIDFKKTLQVIGETLKKGAAIQDCKCERPAR